MEKFLRVKQVAEMLGVSKSAVWLYAKQGKIPKGTKLSPRVTVWKASEIAEVIERAGRDESLRA